ITIHYNGAPISNDDKNLIRYLTNDRELQSTELKVKKQIDSAKIQHVSLIIKDLLNTQDLSDDGEKLASKIKAEFNNLVEDLTILKGEHNNPAYPNKSVIDSGLDTFKTLKSEPDAELLFDKLINMQEQLNEWNDNYRLLKSFFNSQKRIFDEALKVCKLIQDNEIYMEIYKGPKMDELRSLHKDIKAIIELSSPYSEIKNLPPLTEQLKNVFNEALDGFKYGERQCTEIRYAEIQKEARTLGLDEKFYINLYKNEIVNRIDSIVDFGQMTALTNKGYNYYLELLKQMTSDASAKQISEHSENTENNEEVSAVGIKELEIVKIADVVISSQILETEEDVDNYINDLANELKQKIRANKRLKLQ
ncbi:MAG: hypothetical protein ACI4S3_09540, partial [Candidatus Gastranaerophilaceae bacterium]